MVKSHYGLLMDDDFTMTFRDDKIAKKDVEINYIDLGDLLTLKGTDILEIL